MLDHVAIQCADHEASGDFYALVLATLGYHRLVDAPDVIGFGDTRPSFWCGPRRTGQGFRETHLAFLAPSRAAVDAFHAAAVQAGAQVLYPPQLWPQYHPGYYATFVRDPDGNNVEAVAHS